jgi:hypothetical protein
VKHFPNISVISIPLIYKRQTIICSLVKKRKKKKRKVSHESQKRDFNTKYGNKNSRSFHFTWAFAEKTYINLKSTIEPLPTKSFAVFSFDIARALVGHLCSVAMQQKRSPQVELTCSSKKLMRTSPRRSVSTLLGQVVGGGDVKPSSLSRDNFLIFSHLLFAYLSLKMKPAYNLEKKGQELAHWSLSIAAAATVITALHLPPHPFTEDKTREKRTWHALFCSFQGLP